MKIYLIQLCFFLASSSFGQGDALSQAPKPAVVVPTKSAAANFPLNTNFLPYQEQAAFIPRSLGPQSRKYIELLLWGIQNGLFQQTDSIDLFLSSEANRLPRRHTGDGVQAMYYAQLDAQFALAKKENRRLNVDKILRLVNQPQAKLPPPVSQIETENTGHVADDKITLQFGLLQTIGCLPMPLDGMQGFALSPDQKRLWVAMPKDPGERLFKTIHGFEKTDEGWAHVREIRPKYREKKEVNPANSTTYTSAITAEHLHLLPGGKHYLSQTERYNDDDGDLTWKLYIVSLAGDDKPQEVKIPRGFLSNSTIDYIAVSADGQKLLLEFHHGSYTRASERLKKMGARSSEYVIWDIPTGRIEQTVLTPIGPGGWIVLDLNLHVTKQMENHEQFRTEDNQLTSFWFEHARCAIYKTCYWYQFAVFNQLQFWRHSEPESMQHILLPSVPFNLRVAHSGLYMAWIDQNRMIWIMRTSDLSFVTKFPAITAGELDWAQDSDDLIFLGTDGRVAMVKHEQFANCAHMFE